VKETRNLDIPSADQLVMGKLFIIRGTEVSFYIPPTGVEIVTEKWEGGERYAREAVTLERLEYCLLLDQNGTKRYVHGPDVVFPRPTEKFVEAGIKSNPDKAKAKKFRAQELTAASGIHIRVIADYEEEDGTKRTAGDELFITGAQQTIYYPREEHAIIKYGEQEIYYGIAIPVGEARYVLNRDTGVINLVKGPQIFLPDPRTQVIVNRALPLSLVELMYPGNSEAIAVNAARLNITNEGSGLDGDAIYDAIATNGGGYAAAVAAGVGDTSRRVMIRGASKALPGDAFDRKNKHTPPRSIVLNTKFDGAVTADIYTGYAMLLVRKSGERRVVQGPQTVTFEYDESPQVMSLSRGKPKTTDDLLRTVYLLTKANKVADIINLETKDFIKSEVKLSYRVNFEGKPENWFNVDNYVKFLCDHMRSRVRAAVQKLGVEEFYSNHTDIIRDVVLGVQSKVEGELRGKRPGTTFTENGMVIYDVEVLDVKLLNADVESLLVKAQRSTIQNTLLLADEERKLKYVNAIERLKQDTEIAKAETEKRSLQLRGATAKLQLEHDLLILEATAQTAEKQAEQDRINTEARIDIQNLQLDQNVKAKETDLLLAEKAQAQRKAWLEAETTALVEKAKAFAPDLINAMAQLGERNMISQLVESMAPMSIIGGTSVVDVVTKLLEGTPYAKQIASVAGALTNGNGSSKKSGATA
jgi:major vault protein